MTRRQLFAAFVLVSMLGVVVATRIADAQYSPAGGNTFGGLTSLFGGATASGPGAAAVTLNLGDGASLDGQLPNGFQQAQTMGGSAGGTSAATTILQGDGTGTSAFPDGGGANFNFPATETVLGSATTFPVVNSTCGAVTTDGTTWVTCGTYLPVGDEADVWSVTCVWRDATATDGGNGTGDSYSGSLFFNSTRAFAGTTALAPAAPAITNTNGSAANAFVDGGYSANPSIRAQLTGSTIMIQVQGVPSFTIKSACGVQIQGRLN